MYKFRKFTGAYSVEAITTRSDGTASKYSAKISLLANYQNEKKSYLFELTSRSKVMLNDEPPTQIVDKFMLQLSTTYYPIKLEVSETGEIIGVKNFTEIVKRWQKEVDSIMKKSPCIAYKQYIDMAKRNIDSEKSFLKALKRDSFIHFYFRNYAKNIAVKLEGFPTNEENFQVELYRKNNSADENMYKYESVTDTDYEASLVCELSDLAYIVLVKSEFVYRYSDVEVKKEVKISAESTTAKKENKLVSFLFD